MTLVQYDAEKMPKFAEYMWESFYSEDVKKRTNTKEITKNFINA